MSLAGTDEQKALEESVEGLLARYATSESRRGSLEKAPLGQRPDAWPVLAEAGLLGMHLPEEYGGGDGDLTDLCVLLERSGRALLAGPLLPAVLSSALVAKHGDGAQHARWLPGLAAGAVGAVSTTADGMEAFAEGDGWVLAGTSGPVLGCLASELLVLTAWHDGRQRWFLVEPSAPGLTIERHEGVDLTRDLGTVTAKSVRVDRSSLLDVETDDVLALCGLLFSAEAVGIARWCQETGLAYAKVREQFGRPIGSFQSIKHKCARLFIDTELMTASVWDAAVASRDDPDHFRFAAAAAAERCLAPAVDIGLSTVTLLGGIGYTWEHDLHLYWRRSVSVAALLGPGHERAARAVALARAAGPSQRLDLGDEPDGLRARVAEQLRQAGGLEEPARRLFLAEAGLVAPHYPPPYGIGADARAQLIVGQEFARARIAQPSLSIGDWAIPTVLVHGTDAQREQLVGPTLRGELSWCQLFSEPEAGSDLASLRTRAVQADGGWRLTGTKVWTSGADKAGWGICLARTDPEAPKHRGLSYFLVDMKTAGIDVRPLREANGGYLFNEVFLTDVFVPDDYLLGQPGRGWQLARTTLGNERLSLGAGGGGGDASLTDILGQFERFGTEPPVGAAADTGRLVGRRYALEALGRRVLAARLAGSEPGPAASVLKVERAWLLADVARAALDWDGPVAATLDTQAESSAHAYLSTPPQIIGGGTPEIQLNVISEQILGLPRG